MKNLYKICLDEILLNKIEKDGPFGLMIRNCILLTSHRHRSPIVLRFEGRLMA